MLNRRVAQQEDTPYPISENGNSAADALKTILWGIMAGIGMGIGYFIVRKSVKKAGLE